MSVLALTEGAKRVLETDPHGWILTGISVFVVFGCLIILYFIYNFSGNIFAGKYKKKPKAPKGKDAEVAAAIAMALDAHTQSGLEAAIALALHLELSQDVHDQESGIITIKNTESAWNNKALSFRRLPNRK